MEKKSNKGISGFKRGGPTNLFGWVPKAQEVLPSSFNIYHAINSSSASPV
jgi:hypothetical protein